MLEPPPGLRVLVATKPIDFRKGADGLAALAQEVLKQDPLSGVALVFRAKRADRIKILLWDGLYWGAIRPRLVFHLRWQMPLNVAMTLDRHIGRRYDRIHYQTLNWPNALLKRFHMYTPTTQRNSKLLCG